LDFELNGNIQHDAPAACALHWLFSMTFPQLISLALPVVETAQQKLPPPLGKLASAIPVHCEARPGQELLDEGFEDDILGLFTGSAYGSDYREDQPMPAQIILYLENLWEFADGDEAVFRDEVRITYLHELGHYFGWDEDDLAARELD
jgi:predicted Zn-dependent protease with MMP-like domain